LFFVFAKKSKLQKKGKKKSQNFEKSEVFSILLFHLGKDFFVSFITLYITSIKNKPFRKVRKAD